MKKQATTGQGEIRYISSIPEGKQAFGPKLNAVSPSTVVFQRFLKLQRGIKQ